MYTGSEKKAHEQLPNYIGAFDVCLMPFLVNDLTVCVNPVKLYEYLALGKPVITTNIPEVRLYQDIVYIAESRDEFVRMVENALSELEDPVLRNRLYKTRVQAASTNTWSERGKQIDSIVSSALCRSNLGAVKR